VRPVGASPDSKPAVIADTQLAAVHIKEQRLQRLSDGQKAYLQQWLR
jgi:acyl-CoA thioester hydrolase